MLHTEDDRSLGSNYSIQVSLKSRRQAFLKRFVSHAARKCLKDSQLSSFHLERVALAFIPGHYFSSKPTVSFELCLLTENVRFSALADRYEGQNG